jgi:hypothetical protein
MVRVYMLVPMDNEILRFLGIPFNIVLLMKFLPDRAVHNRTPATTAGGAAALPTLVPRAPIQSMTGSRAGGRMLQAAARKQEPAYVVARIVPVASDYENSLVRVARATRLILDNGFDEAIARSQGEDNADGL